jgi:non-heme Fe2+,alpha-ketoglutarate-dependent halogenase
MSQPAFIPPSDALETVPRDLRFHTTPNAAFNRDGYLKPFRIFDSAEISAVRSYFDDLLARTLAAGGTSYSISTAHLRYGRVYDILRDARIVAHVRGLLGDDLIGWGSHFFCKMPGDGKRVSWHQDASYWPLTPSKTVTVWLAIDDADAGNACMRYLPRSHWHGQLTYTLTEDDDSNVLNQTVTDAAQFGDPVDVELRAGEISLHSDLLVHGSEANQSARRRCGLTLRYCPAEVRAGLGWNAKGVVVSGSDPSGHWANPPRPVED